MAFTLAYSKLDTTDDMYIFNFRSNEAQKKQFFFLNFSPLSIEFWFSFSLSTDFYSVIRHCWLEHFLVHWKLFAKISAN